MCFYSAAGHLVTGAVPVVQVVQVESVKAHAVTDHGDDVFGTPVGFSSPGIACATGEKGASARAETLAAARACLVKRHGLAGVWVRRARGVVKVIGAPCVNDVSSTLSVLFKQHPING